MNERTANERTDEPSTKQVGSFCHFLFFCFSFLLSSKRTWTWLDPPGRLEDTPAQMNNHTMLPYHASIVYYPRTTPLYFPIPTWRRTSRGRRRQQRDNSKSSSCMFEGLSCCYCWRKKGHDHRMKKKQDNKMRPPSSTSSSPPLLLLVPPRGGAFVTSYSHANSTSKYTYY
jgi:hypothetical protein